MRRWWLQFILCSCVACNGSLTECWNTPVEAGVLGDSSLAADSGLTCLAEPEKPGPSPLPPSPPGFPPPPYFEFNGTIAPNPLISRGKPAFSSTGQASAVNNGNYRWDGGTWTGWQGAWVAIQLGAGPSRILFQWSAGANYNYTDTANVPSAYRIEVSSNSTNGADGNWVEAVTVTGNAVRTRTHLVQDFEGMSWVRMHILSGGANLDEIDVYDASLGSFDSWFFLGDSITAHAFDRSKAHGSFAELVHERWPNFFPVVVNGGVGTEKTGNGLNRLDSALAEHRAIQFWAVCFGSNDVGDGNNGWGLDTFRQNLLRIVERIQAAGRIPVIPQIPFIWDANQSEDQREQEGCRLRRPDLPKFNKVIDEIIEQTGALPGPDLYTYFSMHCEQFPRNDGLHPSAEGYQAMNRLWAEAMATIYETYSSPPHNTD